jgi:maltose-binding protein MalE
MSLARPAAGAWNPNDVGLDSEGMIAAVTYHGRCRSRGPHAQTPLDDETAHSMFETGQIPFLMAGPWALDRIRASGVPYAITDLPRRRRPLPRRAGLPGQPA